MRYRRHDLKSEISVFSGGLYKYVYISKSSMTLQLCLFLQRPHRDQGILVTKPIVAVPSLYAFHDYQNIDCVWNITPISGRHDDDTTGQI